MRKILPTLIVLAAFGILIFVYINQIIKDPPILKDDRLGDVVTAIAVMGIEKFDGHEPEFWEKRIGSLPKSVDSWLDIFKEHSEFFYVYKDEKGNNKVSLLWRRARNWSWDTKTLKEIDLIELENEKKWPKEKKNDRITRKPLDNDEVIALVEIVFNMHSRNITLREEQRWWIPVLFGFLGVLVGALLKGEKRQG